MADNRFKRMILEALTALHSKSRQPLDEQWFTRRNIAGQVEAKAGLNPSRINALEALVAEKKIVKRQRPNEGRDLPEYSLA